MPPDWVHQLPTGGGLAQFYGIAGLVSGPEWWGLAVLVLLAAIAAVAFGTGRRTLAVLSVLTLVAAVGVVVTVASIPTSLFLILGYLGVVLAPIGVAVWVTFIWAVGEVVLTLPFRSEVLETDGVSATVVIWARWPTAAVLAREDRLCDSPWARGE